MPLFQPDPTMCRILSAQDFLPVSYVRASGCGKRNTLPLNAFSLSLMICVQLSKSLIVITVFQFEPCSISIRKHLTAGKYTE
ncbi:hypothetical protein CS542_04715 [Pedobacter sp. IW39]|nr:hypothetical protein CS542_04715 [Pedobacter sp. IW39]